MIIARLLTPAEIGVFSVTMVMLMFVATVRDLGAGQYLVQERELTTERIRAVWAVQLGLGLALSCVVLAASNPVAVFYNEPRMREIMLLIAVSYAINPFGSLTYAWLMREMRFESIAVMRFTSTLTGALVSTVLAWQDFGPISLAFGSLAMTIVNALIAVFYRPKSFPWFPGLSEVKRVLSFGSQLTSTSIVGVLSGSAPELLLGKLQSLTAAGLYSRSSGLVNMFHKLFVDAVAAVCLPWFAKQSREQGGFAAPFLKATSYVVALGWSFCLVIIFLAQPIVRVLYGSQWDQSVDLARLLATAAAFNVPAALCFTALVSSGAVTKVVRVTVISAIQSIALVALGASMGLTELGVAIIASSAVGSFLWLQAASQHIHWPQGELLRTLGSSAQVALVAAIVPAVVFFTYGPYPEVSLLPLLIGGLGGTGGFVFAVMFFRHPLHEELLSIWTRFKPSARS